MNPHTSEFDILLTYPAEKLQTFDSMIPMGIASVAGNLEANGYRVKIIDFNYYKGDFRRDLRRWNPKLLGIGGTTPTRRGSFLTARLAKEILPNLPVAYGGPHASFTANDTLTNVPEIDFVLKGEGEHSFLALADSLTGRRPIETKNIAGLCFREGPQVIENRPIRIDDLDALPMPARHLFGPNYHLSIDFFNYEADFLMTSRGCPAACAFCAASRMFPGGVRCRSAENIAVEIEAILSQRPVKALKLFDSTFTSSRAHVESFCNMIRRFDLKWECEARADTLDRDLLAIMKDAGCVYINIGLETANASIMRSIAKNVSVAQVDSCLKWCRGLDIKTKLFMIFGHLGQTFEQCIEDVRFIRSRKHLVDFYATTIGMRIFPGTQVERRAKARGLMPADFSWVKYKPPLRNWVLMEAGDVFILEQPGLGILQLARIIPMLGAQRTIASGGYIFKMVLKNAVLLLMGLSARFRYMRHKLARAWE